jgi:hypothetical protein
LAPCEANFNTLIRRDTPVLVRGFGDRHLAA